MNTRFVAAIAAVLFGFSVPTVAAMAQSAPTPVPTAVPSVPPNIGQQAIDALGNIVRGAFGWNDNESIGTVTFYRGYEMQMRMQLGRYREIHLHRGTVINPRGYTIKPGDTVDVKGRPNGDGSLNADMIVLQHSQ